MSNLEILNAVKLLSDIFDDSQDEIINYYISALQRRIINICRLSSFPLELLDLVVDIIVKKLKDDAISTLDLLNIGDTNIKVKNDSKNIIGYLEENMSELKKFRYAEVI